jgi:hypothetical protein
MARQIGEIILVGTIEGLTFYQMEGKGYARLKSSLNGKRVKRDPKFKRTMRSAHRLGKGSQLASKVYRSLPRREQEYSLYKELKSTAVLGLKEGKSEGEVMELLQRHLPKKEMGSPVFIDGAGELKEKTNTKLPNQQMASRKEWKDETVRLNRKALYRAPFSFVAHYLPRLRKRRGGGIHNKNAGQVESPARKECVVKLFSG